MDQYLDPTLSGSLGFLDAPIHLEPASTSNFSGPSHAAGVLDFDQWLNPTSAATYETHGGLSGASASSAAGPLSHDARDLPLQQGSYPLATAEFHAYPSPVQPGVYATVSPSTRNAIHHGPIMPAGHLGSPCQAAYQGNVLQPEASGSLCAGPKRHTVAHGMHAPRTSLQASPPSAVGPDPASYSIAAYGSPKAKPSLALVAPRSHMTRSVAQSAQQQYMAYQSPPVSPAGARRSPRTSLGQGGRVHQPDESVPEAALHLLRLAQPDGSVASAASTSTKAGGDDLTSIDDELEARSDDTSIHSAEMQNKSLAKALFGHEQAVPQHAQLETRIWQHNPDQPPLHVQRGGGPNSPRPSVASSIASTFGPRQDSAGQTQRAGSVYSSHSRAASEAPSIGSVSHGSPAPQQQPARRTSARVRQLRGSTAGSVSLPEPVYMDEAEEAGESPASSDLRSSTRGSRPAKRDLLAEGRNKAPAKRPRPAKRKENPSEPLPPRKARRQVFLPPTLEQRTLAPGVEPHPDFPRFYRKFPVSSAFHPECFVVRPPTGSRSLPRPPRPQPAPATPMSVYGDATFAPAAMYCESPNVLASTSMGLPGIPIEAASPFSVYNLPPAATEPNFASTLGAGPSSGFSQDHQLSQDSHGGSTSIGAGLISPKASSSLPLTPVSASPSGSIGPGGLPMISGPNGVMIMQPPADAKWNKVSDPLNLYWPRFIKGAGDEKCGLCPICAEPPERGGDGEQKWFKVRHDPPRSVLLAIRDTHA